MSGVWVLRVEMVFDCGVTKALEFRANVARTAKKIAFIMLEVLRVRVRIVNVAESFISIYRVEG